MRLLLLALIAACGSNQASTSPGRPTPGPRPPQPGGRIAAPDSPYETKTWIAKLRDPRESDAAISALQELGDPSAIPALGDAWLAQGRPPRLINVILSIARPLTPDEAKATYKVDFEATGRPASWDKALPYLSRAVTEVDDADPRSVDNALAAAMGLGEAKQGRDALTHLAQRPVTKKLVGAHVAAVRALGEFVADDEAARALVRLISREAPKHPRTGTTKETTRALEEGFALYLASVGASINALAQLRTPMAALPLVLAMYRAPELFTQVRRALVATGPTAKAELRKVLRNESTDVNDLFRAHKLDQYCGDRGDQPCLPVSAKDFYASVVLGDFYDAAAVPDLLEVLKRPPHPVYYSDDQPSGNTQLNAAFDALRKIGAPSVAAQVQGIWTAKARIDLNTRMLAVSAYPYVARDTTGVAALAKIAADNAADDTLRQEAATALARLSVELKDVAALDKLAKRYLDASAEKTKAAAALQKDKDAADKALDTARQTLVSPLGE